MRNYSDRARSVAWYLFMTVFIIYALVVGWWLLYPYEPIVVESPIKIMNPDKKVRAGDKLIYQIRYNKKMDVHGTLTRKLVNNYKMDLAESYVTAPIGPDYDQVVIPTPAYADPGKYYLWWSVAYKVNPLRVVTVSVESEKFEVVK